MLRVSHLVSNVLFPSLTARLIDNRQQGIVQQRSVCERADTATGRRGRGTAGDRWPASSGDSSVAVVHVSSLATLRGIGGKRRAGGDRHL